MTNEAPPPDEVEKAVTAFNFCISCIKDGCLWSTGSLDKPHITTKNLKDVMAHIAAQAEKISALEKKLSEQIREDEMRLINHCVKIVGNNSKAHIHAEAEFLTRIAALEADNKRLREAINEYVMCCPADRDTTSSFLKASDKLESALAQTGEK